MKLSDIRIAGKLSGLVLIALAGIAWLGFLGYLQVNKVFVSASYSTVNTVPSLSTLDTLRDNYLHTRIYMSQHILNNAPETKAELEKSIKRHREGVRASLNKYAAYVSDEQDRQYLKDTENLWAEYDASIDPMLAESRKGEGNQARATELLNESWLLAELIAERINAQIDLKTQLGNKGTEEAAGTKDTALTWSIFIALLEMALLVSVAWLMGRKGMVDPINGVVEDLKNLADGRLDVTVRGHERRDEVGDIARAAQVFKEFAQKLNVQHWVKSQVAALSSEIQPIQGLEDFSQTVISRMVPLLEGGAAALYVLAPDSGRYALMGRWGLKEDAQLATSYLPGEGLVGQCVVEKSPIMLKEVPGDYIRIFSGLGEAVPDVILLTPIIAKGRVVGVIEIASFHRFTEAQQALIDELLPVLALNLEIIERNRNSRK